MLQGYQKEEELRMSTILVSKYFCIKMHISKELGSKEVNHVECPRHPVRHTGKTVRIKTLK